MTINRDDIIDLALRYISSDEIIDFPNTDDLFVFFERNIPEKKILKVDEGWGFAGYGICIGYEKDYNSKPEGKWLWFSFLSLNSFPPNKQKIKLQPPHIVRGLFQTPGRTSEIKILKLPIEMLKLGTDISENKSNQGDDSKTISKNNILKFPKK